MKSKEVCIRFVSKVSANRSRELILGQISTPIRIRYYLGGHSADHHHQVVQADIPGCYWTFLFPVSSPELATVLISIIITLYRPFWLTISSHFTAGTVPVILEWIFQVLMRLSYLFIACNSRLQNTRGVGLQAVSECPRRRQVGIHSRVLSWHYEDINKRSYRMPSNIMLITSIFYLYIILWNLVVT